MTTSGKIDAATSARQEDRELTEIAQIAPGNTAKARESLVNGNIPLALLAAFQAAADSADYAQRIETFNLQQEQKAVVQQQADEKNKKEEQKAWLDGMSTEYKQAYSQLMTTVDTADSEYDRMRQRLQERGKRLDQEASEIDDKALHLSDGSRAYVNSDGVLVDKNGVPLKGKAATEAKALAQRHNGPISSIDSYQRNEQSRAENKRLQERVDAEQGEADKFRKDVADGKVKDTKKVQEGTQDIESKLKTTKNAASNFYATDAKASNATKASFSDLDDDSPPATPTADRTSFAKKVDDNAGIKANKVSAPFGVAARPPDPAPTPTPPPSPQKPAAGGPSPT